MKQELIDDFVKAVTAK